jgi:hypothetical protein
MSDDIRIPLRDAPAVLTESLACVLRAHGYVIAKRSIDQLGPQAFVVDIEQLSDTELAAVLREAGNNGAQALTSLEVFEDDAPGAA